ncbi:MAG: MBL fold metallo-hydrolase [Desulfobacteraceae bacterium]|nr:MBL fold metallo-hydrolase [Desulfobacteraceae bacterium]
MVRQRGLFKAMPPVNLYVIPGENGLIYDAGYGNRAALDLLAAALGRIKAMCRKRSVPFNFTRIIPSHTHPDHFSGLVKIRKRFGTAIVLTEEMAGILRSKKSYGRTYRYQGSGKFYFPVSPLKRVLADFSAQFVEQVFDNFYFSGFIPDPDMVIKSRTTIRINQRQWQVFPSPGHSEDHISLYDPEAGILFSGDNVLRTVTPWLGPPRSSLTQYVNSLEKLLGLPGLKLILPAHGSPVTEPKQRIRELIGWRQQRVSDVLDIIGQSGSGGVTLANLLKILYRGQGMDKRFLAEGWVLLTLDHLLEKGLIKSFQHNKTLRFSINTSSGATL